MLMQAKRDKHDKAVAMKLLVPAATAVTVVRLADECDAI